MGKLFGDLAENSDLTEDLAENSRSQPEMPLAPDIWNLPVVERLFFPLSYKTDRPTIASRERNDRRRTPAMGECSRRWHITGLR
jgi:hypothetical protein